jgi:nicotinamide-nucleotide amidase
MKAMLDETIIPFLLEHLEGERQIIVSRVLRASGVGESTLAEPLEDIFISATNPTVAPLIYGNTEVHLRLTAKARDEQEAKQLLDAMEEKIRVRVGEQIFGTDNQTLPWVVLQLLQEQGKTLSVAESLTGGVLQSFITETPGASEVFTGGIVAYSSNLKEKILGVPRAMMTEYSVVSAEIAEAMAEGACHKMSTSIGLSTTGEAGPNSSTDAPVGTVWIGLCDGQSTHSYKREYFGDRDAIRRRAALSAIDILRRHLLGLPIAE